MIFARALLAGIVASGWFTGAALVHASEMTANQETIDAASLVATVPPAPGAPTGVSPEVYFDEATGTYYLLTTAVPPTQYSSPDGLTWTPMSTLLPAGIDWSIVKEGPNSYRLYYAEMSPGAGGAPPKPCAPKTKVLRYATSADLRTWTVQPGVLLDDVGCGVPHVMKTASGNYYLYFNKVEGKHGIFTSTSSDGLTWSSPVGPLNGNEDLVDPAPLQLPDGTFVMVASTTGGKGGYQQLQLLASKDALTWVQRKTTLLADSGGGVFDPSIELVGGQLRVWFGYSPAGSHEAARITQGILTLGSTPARPAVSATCVKVKSAKVPTVSCVGSSIGIDPGSTVVPHVRVGKKGAWKTVAVGQPRIDDKGGFSWRFRPQSAALVSIYFTVGDTRSTTATVIMR